jgi:hypothetical protein
MASQKEEPKKYAPLQCVPNPFPFYGAYQPTKMDEIDTLPVPGPMLAIVTTADAEREAVLDHLDDMKCVSAKVAGSYIIYGKIGRFYTVVLQTDMGSSATSDYLKETLPRLPSVKVVAFVGFAWGAKPAFSKAPKDKERQRIGDVMFATNCLDCSHNKYTNAGVEVRGEITAPVSGILFKVNNALIEAWQASLVKPEKWERLPTVHKGAFISMPSLMNNASVVEAYVKSLSDRKPVGGDMEVYQIAKAVKELEQPRKWFAIKSICDFGGLVEKTDEGQPLAARSAADFMHFIMTSDGLFDELLKPDSK